MVIIETRRDGYSPEQVGGTATVAELIEYLSEYEDGEEVYLSFDNGYTYGGISRSRIHDGEADDGSTRHFWG